MTTNAITEQPELVAFLNVKSGRHLRNPAVLRGVEALCRNRATLVRVDSEPALEQEIRRLPNHPGVQVAILGGDGTHMRVMSSLFRVFGPSQLPLLVPIPFGTVGTICRRWRAGNSPWRALASWVRREPMVLRRQESLSILLDESEQLVGCTLGTGLVAQFFERYESLGAHGFLPAGRIALQSFIGSFVSSPFARSLMQPLYGRVSVDGNEILPRQFSLIVSSVFKDVGLGIQVTYRAGNEHGRIALVTSSLPARRLGPQFWRVLTARPLVDPEGINALVREWSLQFAQPSPIIVDGNRFSARTLRVRPGPTWSVLTRN